MRSAVIAAVGAVVLAAPAWAQTPGSWNEMPDRFQIDTGYFHVDSTATLRYQGRDVRVQEVPVFSETPGVMRVQYKVAEQPPEQGRFPQEAMDARAGGGAARNCDALVIATELMLQVE